MTPEQRIAEIEAVLQGQGSYVSKYSGEEIDALLDGHSLQIKGVYANLAAIRAAYPNGTTGALQAADTKNLYVWNEKTRAWESIGPMQGPIGPKGEPGPKGDTGAVGPVGPQGAQGPKGPKGDTGPCGLTGQTGPQGPKGDKGSKGDTGAQGPMGPQGGRGPMGIQGPQGPAGPQGIPGEQGPRGINGAAVAADGIYAFNVNASGHLILSYTGEDAPNFVISNSGHLILTI